MVKKKSELLCVWEEIFFFGLRVEKTTNTTSLSYVYLDSLAGMSSGSDLYSCHLKWLSGKLTPFVSWFGLGKKIPGKRFWPSGAGRLSCVLFSHHHQKLSLSFFHSLLLSINKKENFLIFKLDSKAGKNSKLSPNATVRFLPF